MKNILENNKLIAEFMGFKLTDRVILPDEYKGEDSHFSILEFIDIIRESEGLTPTSLKNLNFNSDWNWLIEVVEKCLSSPEIGESRDWDHHYASIHDGLWELSKENTYTAVVEFIKWYNKNK